MPRLPKLFARTVHGDHRRESSAGGVAAFDRDLQALLAENFLQVPSPCSIAFSPRPDRRRNEDHGLAPTLSYF